MCIAQAVQTRNDGRNLTENAGNLQAATSRAKRDDPETAFSRACAMPKVSATAPRVRACDGKELGTISCACACAYWSQNYRPEVSSTLAQHS